VGVAAAMSATLGIALAMTFAAIFSTNASAQAGLNNPLSTSLTDIPLPPDEATQKQIVADVKAKAFDFDKNLPDFACTQLSHHNLDAKGTNQWKTLDTVSEQLRFVHHIEEYTMMAQNGKKMSGAEKRAAGLSSVKDFTDMLRFVFDPKAKAEIAWAQWDSVRGHRVHKLLFLVQKDNSDFKVGKGHLQSGLAGFIYADSDTNAVLRLEMAATTIPKNYPVQGVAMDIIYDFTRMGDKIYLLPIKADFHEKQGKSVMWDEVEFKDFRQP
jgi:hypothetical protein